MSTSTPAAPSTSQDQNAIVRNYLERRGFAKAVQAFDADLAGNSQPGAPPSSSNRSLNVDEFAGRNAPAANTRAQTAAQTASLAPAENNKWRNMADPTAWESGLKSLTAFCLGSLSLHRAELSEVLWPIFVHIYLELVPLSDGLTAPTNPTPPEAAQYQKVLNAPTSVMQNYGHYFEDYHKTVMRELKAIKTADHVQQSEMAQRWRSERYILPLSDRGWGLLQSWLAGGGLLDAASTSAKGGSAAGQTSMGDRGRDKILAIINERIELRIGTSQTQSKDVAIGLVSETGTRRTQSGADGPLEAVKIGLSGLDSKLEKEVNRTLREKDEDQIPPAPDSSLIPTINELPPYPANFKVADVQREVEKVRDGRKRIRLGPEAFSADGTLSMTDATGRPNGSHTHPGGVFKPSVCIFSVHDTQDGLTSTTVSHDASVLACGFSDSHIRVWNLKGDRFKTFRSDFDPAQITKPSQLKNMRVRDGVNTLKLVGHSGPVYSLAFDPLSGYASGPKHLLSASQDATVRLWSTETGTNLVAYRGHRDPIWDVEWGPKGVYFATGSRDRTARLWVTDRTSPLRIMAGHLSDVDCVKFHPNSMYLATGSSDRTCRLWDVQKGSAARVFVGHQGGVTAIAMSPDGRYLASAAEDHTIHIWDISSGKLIKPMKGHTSRINSLAFSMESTVLLSGSSDETIRIWDVEAQGKDAAMSGVDLKSLGLNAEGFSGLKSTSAMSLSDSLRGEGNSSATLAVLPKSAFAEEDTDTSPDLLGVLVTKQTPVHHVSFTERNLALAAGPA